MAKFQVNLEYVNILDASTRFKSHGIPSNWDTSALIAVFYGAFGPTGTGRACTCLLRGVG